MIEFVEYFRDDVHDHTTIDNQNRFHIHWSIERLHLNDNQIEIEHDEDKFEFVRNVFYRLNVVQHSVHVRWLKGDIEVNNHRIVSMMKRWAWEFVVQVDNKSHRVNVDLQWKKIFDERQGREWNQPKLVEMELLFRLFFFNSTDRWSCLVNNFTSSLIFCNRFKLFFVFQGNFSSWKYFSTLSINEQWLVVVPRPSTFDSWICLEQKKHLIDISISNKYF